LNDRLDAIDLWTKAMRSRDGAEAEAAVRAGQERCGGDDDPLGPIFSSLETATSRFRDQLRRGKPSERVACSFCSASVDAEGVDTLVAGPGVFICNGCVEAGREALSNGQGTSGRCSFCANSAASAFALREATICADCIEVCLDIQHDHDMEASWWV